MEDAGRDAQLAIIAEIQDWKERDVRALGYILSTTEVSIYRLTPNIYNPVDNFPTLSAINASSFPLHFVK